MLEEDQLPHQHPRREGKEPSTMLVYPLNQTSGVSDELFQSEALEHARKISKVRRLEQQRFRLINVELAESAVLSIGIRSIHKG